PELQTRERIACRNRGHAVGGNGDEGDHGRVEERSVQAAELQGRHEILKSRIVVPDLYVPEGGVGRCECQAERPDEGEQHQQRRGKQQYEVHDPAPRGAGAWKQLARFLDLGGGHLSLPARSATNVSPAMKANSTKAIAEAEPMLE